MIAPFKRMQFMVRLQNKRAQAGCGAAHDRFGRGEKTRAGLQRTKLRDENGDWIAIESVGRASFPGGRKKRCAAPAKRIEKGFRVRFDEVLDIALAERARIRMRSRKIYGLRRTTMKLQFWLL